MFRTQHLSLATLALLLLGRPLCAQSERVYFLSGEGLHSVTTSGDDERHLAPWGASAGTCATAANGLSVDEIAGWATVSCGQKFFKIHYDDPSLGPDPWVLLTFGSSRVIRDYYGTAINTDTHTAYVAAFEQEGWRVKGVYLSGCGSITDTAECAEHNPCSWSVPRDACVDKTGYAQLEVSSLSDVGGGLFADERNKIWFAYFDEQATASEKQGGFVVSNQKESADDPSAVVSYPHVHDTFKAEQPGEPAMEMGYPQKANGTLFVLQQTDDATALLRFDGAPEPSVVYDGMPPFKGSRTGSSSTIRQPSFAMLSESSLIHSTEDGIVLLEGVCAGCTAAPVSTPLVTRQNVGPIFYRVLPKAPPDTPTPDTPGPDTPLPEGAGDTPAPEAAATTTAAPAGTPPDTPAPTPAPDGAEGGNGTRSPGGAGGSSTEAPSETSGAAPSEDGGGGVSVLTLLLLIGGSMLLCLCVGLAAGTWYKGRFKKQAQQRAQLPTDDEMLMRAAERPPTPPSATAAYVAAGDRQTSLSMIQTVDLPTKTRTPAVDLHQPAPPATQQPQPPPQSPPQSPPQQQQQQQQQQQPSPPAPPPQQQQSIVVGAAAVMPAGRGPRRSFKAPEPLSPLSVGRGGSIRPPSRGATPTNLTSPLSVSGGSTRRPTPRARFASVSDRSQASDLAQTFIQQRASQNQQRLSQHLSVVAVEDM